MKDAVGKCTSEIYKVSLVDFQPSKRGKSGSFTGTKQYGPPGNSEIYVVNEVNAFNSDQLTALHIRFGGHAPTGPREMIGGLTIPFRTREGVETGFSPYRNFTARDRGKALTNIEGVDPFTETQIWELSTQYCRRTGACLFFRFKLLHFLP